MQKKFDIKYEEGEGLERVEFSGFVIMKRLSFAEKNALEEECTDIQFISNISKIKVSIAKMKELGPLKGIVNAELKRTTFTQEKITKGIIPVQEKYNLTLDGIRNLPQNIGDYLFQCFTEMNNVSEKKNVNSENSSKEAT